MAIVCVAFEFYGGDRSPAVAIYNLDELTKTELDKAVRVTETTWHLEESYTPKEIEEALTIFTIAPDDWEKLKKIDWPQEDETEEFLVAVYSAFRFETIR